MNKKGAKIQMSYLHMHKFIIKLTELYTTDENWLSSVDIEEKTKEKLSYVLNKHAQ